MVDKERFMSILTINPVTEEILNSYPLLNEAQVDTIIDAGHACFMDWKKTSFSERRQLMLMMARHLRQKSGELALLMAQEMGKPVVAGMAEIEKCAWVCEYYAEHAEFQLAPRSVKTSMKKSIVCYQPLGLVFAIMPWNFPFWQVFRFAVPTIMAGNAAVFKHAQICTGCGDAIAKLFREAGFPEQLFQQVIIDNDMAAKVIAHDKIVAVTLTGSERAGSIIASNAAKHLKKAVLELGGNDPYIILADADLDLAANCIVTSRLNNTGQVCIAAKRTIAVHSIAAQLIEKIIEQMSLYQLGDPLDPATKIGPMAREDLRNTVHQQVLDSVAKGATLCMGGVIPPGKGYYYPPTLLTNVRPGMPAFDDELFGPVVSCMTVENEAEAIRLANQSRYGLGAAVFTRNSVRGEQIATYDIEAGSCFVNTFVVSDPRLPFGGIKRSGFGRELSQEGILEFVNIKTVAINE